jgi:hypothetical protein
MKTHQIIRIEGKILILREQKVILDSDLAELYGVSTKQLNQQVKRNLRRFPEDFMFKLNEREAKFLRSQFVTSKDSRGGRQYYPYAFTEQGIAMLSSVLNSERAIDANIAIMRAFVRLRQILGANKDLAEKLINMEIKYDEQFEIVFEILENWIAPEPEEEKPPIGFIP